MNNQKFYICKHCGNLIGMIEDSGIPIICCGEAMNGIVPNTVDAAKEKHLPQVEINGDTIDIEISVVSHPMNEEHLIQWVYLQTKNGGQRTCFLPSDEPKVTFKIIEDKPEAVFAYCNLHGLWKTEI